MATGGPVKVNTKCLVISPIRQWLQYVDKQLTREAVEFLKLGLYSEIKGGFERLENVSRATELYNHLLEKRFQNDEQKTLWLFVHVLLGLGKDLRGYHLVSDGLPDYEISKPEPLQESDMSREFKFFQCLLKISTKARKMYLEDKLKVRFAKKLKMNHRNIPDLAFLFISLYQQNLIDWDFTRDLVYALKKYGAWQCLLYLNDYHKSVGQPPIKEVEQISKDLDPYSPSSNPQSLDEKTSDALNEDEQRRINTEKQHRNNYSRKDPQPQDKKTSHLIPISARHISINGDPRTISRSAPIDTGYGNVTDSGSSDGEAVTDSTEESTLLRQTQAAQGQFNSSHSISHRKSIRWWNQGFKIRNCCLIGKWIALTILSLVILSLLFGLIWIHLLKNPLPMTISAIVDNHQITALALQETFFEKCVQISFRRPDNSTVSASELSLYQFNMKCDSLPKTPSPSSGHEIRLNHTTLPSYPPIYALPNSIFDYTIVPIMRSDQSTTNIEVISINVTYNFYNPAQRIEDRVVQEHQQYNFVTAVPKRSIPYRVKEKGYYWFEVHTHEPLDYSFNLTVNPLNKINLLEGEEISDIPDGSYDRNKNCISFNFGPVCLVGKLQFSRSVQNGNWTNDIVEITLESESTWKAVLLGLTISAVVTYFLLLFVFGCCVTYCCCFCKYCKKMFTFRSRNGEPTPV